MDKSGLIIVPRTNASDDQVVLKEWCEVSGTAVEAGQVIALGESSKTVFEMEAPRDGYLHYRIAEEDLVSVGEVVAYVADSPDWTWPLQKADSSRPGFSASKHALALMQAHGVSPDVFAGKELVTKADVEAYLSSGASEPTPSVPVGKRVVMVGGSGHAKTCIEILKTRREYELTGIVDDGMTVGTMVLGVPVLGTLATLEQLAQQGTPMAVLGIGSLFNLPARRKLIERIEGAGMELLTIIHPSAVVEPSAKLGKGVQVHAGAVVSSDTVLHDHCVVNTGAIVSHDCVIGTNAHVAPGAVLAGAVKVGADALVGMGTTVFIGVNIAPGVVVKNGQNIFHDQLS